VLGAQPDNAHGGIDCGGRGKSRHGWVLSAVGRVADPLEPS
jgi:hypothetical protein